MKLSSDTHMTDDTTFSLKLYSLYIFFITQSAKTWHETYTQNTLVSLFYIFFTFVNKQH